MEFSCQFSFLSHLLSLSMALVCRITLVPLKLAVHGETYLSCNFAEMKFLFLQQKLHATNISVPRTRLKHFMKRPKPLTQSVQIRARQGNRSSQSGLCAFHPWHETVKLNRVRTHLMKLKFLLHETVFHMEFHECAHDETVKPRNLS